MTTAGHHDLSRQLALVGSGEFLPVMAAIDAALLDGRAPRAVFLPTASAPDGRERVQYWLDLGDAHFRSLGVEPVGLAVVDRASADDAELAAQVEGAGLVYLSGGNPAFLARTLRGTRVWSAIASAIEGGAALAGCSAGAMAMGAFAPDVKTPDRTIEPGLGVLNHVAVIPHFDTIRGWLPQIIDTYLRAAENAPAPIAVLGIDEDTALVGGPEDWTVSGKGAVHLLVRDAPHTVYPAGSRIRLPLRANS